MRQLTINELMDMATNARGQIDKIYLHWSAGHYNQSHTESYHICIDGAGQLWTDVYDLTEHRDHTWLRNSRAIGISINGCWDAISPTNMGTEPPTEAQIYALSYVVALLCVQIGIPLDIQHVMTHNEAADCLDGEYPHAPYGYRNSCERWDLLVLRQGETPETGGDQIRGNARFIASNEWGINI